MKKLILIPIIVILIISGCKQDGTSVIKPEELRKGTKGLEMSFMENAPPNEVYENMVIPVTIKIKNSGASDIKNGYLVLGIEESYMEFEEGYEIESFNLKGRKLGIPYGEEDDIRFKLKAKELDPQLETLTTTVRATACYKYQTIATETICVDTDPNNEYKGTEKACETKTITLIGGQGGPVAVTKIESKMLAGENTDSIKPQFIIYIENKGEGDIVGYKKIGDICSSNLVSNKEINRLEVKASLSEMELNCNPVPLHLEKEKNYVICTLESGISKDWATFTTPLQIVLDYGYTFSKSTEVRILKALT